MTPDVKKKIKKGNHFLPITYLKNFLHDDKLVMYKKGEKFFSKEYGIEDRMTTFYGVKELNSICKENDLYTVTAPDGTKSDFMEDFFVDLTEGGFNNLVDRVNSIEFLGFLPDDLRKEICTFMASMAVRVPAVKREMESIRTKLFKHLVQRIACTPRVREDMRMQLQQNGYTSVSEDELTSDMNEAIDSLSAEDSIARAATNSFVEHILKNISYFDNIFSNMKMLVLKTTDENNFFITSDRPIVYFVPDHKVNLYNAPKSLVSQYTEVYFPLTKNYCVFLSRRDNISPNQVIPITKEAFDIIEDSISKNSQDYLFSPKKKHSLEPFIKEYIPYPYEFRIQ